VIHVPRHQKEKSKRLSWNGTISGKNKPTSFLMTGKVHSCINTVLLMAVEWVAALKLQQMGTTTRHWVWWDCFQVVHFQSIETILLFVSSSTYNKYGYL
jgi:hypothetical protein